MDLGLAGKVAIVGGASKGIGFAAAHALAAEGARVAIVARNAAEVADAIKRIGNATEPGRVLGVAADLGTGAGAESAFAEASRRWGAVDIVVNNLGGPPPGQPSAITDEQWLAAFNLNFFSAVRLNRLALPGMRQRKFGRIVTVLSLAIKQPEDNLATSTVARTAAAAYAKVLSTEVAAEGITVNNVLPGSIATGRLQAVAEMQARFHNRDVSTAMQQRLELIPARRFGEPEEVGGLIAYLASTRAGFITGLSIPVDGGQLRSMF